MLKPSEITSHTAQLISEMVAEFFDPSEVSVILGDAKVSAQFSQLPFDHLVFTGSTEVGRKVMCAAAKNLTPVTLELGGKSPVVIDKGVDLKTVSLRLMTGKLFNTGQICICPDYAFIPDDSVVPFLSELKKATASLYPSIADNPDYTAIVNDNHFSRLQYLIDSAANEGTEIVTLNPSNEAFDETQNRKMLPRILINPSSNSPVMQSEIFGPLLVIITYRDIQEVIDHIQAHGHPLALYYFGDNDAHEAILRDNVLAGGMAVDDVVVTEQFVTRFPLAGSAPAAWAVITALTVIREFSHNKSRVCPNTCRGYRRLHAPTL